MVVCKIHVCHRRQSTLFCTDRIILQHYSYSICMEHVLGVAWKYYWILSERRLLRNLTEKCAVCPKYGPSDAKTCLRMKFSNSRCWWISTALALNKYLKCHFLEKIRFTLGHVSASDGAYCAQFATEVSLPLLENRVIHQHPFGLIGIDYVGPLLV